MQSERTNDNSMITVRTRCRVIGAVNFIIFSALILILIAASIILIFNKDEKYTMKDEILPVKFIVIIFLVLDIVILLALLYTNYRLMKQNTPSDGRAIKLWIFAHGALITYLFITNVCSMIFYHHHCLVHSISYLVILIILTIELYVVREFKIQIESGVVNQPSNA